MACPGGQPTTGLCLTCGSGFTGCPSGGCYPTGNTVVDYCGTAPTIKCGSCKPGKSLTLRSCVIDSNVLYSFICQSSSSSSSGGCFSGSETLSLKSGEIVTMNQVQVGDIVMVASKDRKISFSPVIVIPHPVNADETEFVKLKTESGRDIKMTPIHLVMGGICGNIHSLKEANSLRVNDCVSTIDGEEIITDKTSMLGNGIYTVVTAADEYLVVNGVLVSPFASNHMVANAFYNIHRAIYEYTPYVASHPVVAKIMKAFGNIIIGAVTV